MGQAAEKLPVAFRQVALTHRIELCARLCGIIANGERRKENEAHNNGSSRSEAKRPKIDCRIANKTVRITWRHGGGLLEPAKAYVRCDERDCQYADLNEPPCPLAALLMV